MRETPLQYLLLLLLFLAACSEKKGSSGPTANLPPLVDAIVVKLQIISNHLEVNGTAIANEYVELHPESSGRITFLNVPEGKWVSAGTVIARVNDADLRAQLEKTNVQLDLAEKTKERYERLLAVNGINQSDYDASLNAVNGFKADVQYTQALIDKTVVKAPFDGVVGLRQVSLGAYISPATLIATIQQVDKTKIDFTLPEEFSAAIHVGGVVEARTSVVGQGLIKANILAIEPQVNQGSRNLKVRAILQHTNTNPGGFVKIYLNAGTDHEGLMVPTNCIIPDDKNKQCVVIHRGKAEFVNVETGVRQANNVEIVNGLHQGDTVVVTGVLFARPNNPVEIRKMRTLDELVN